MVTINSTFIGDYKLKEKYWLCIISLLDKCFELEQEKIEKIIRIKLIAELFQ